MDAHAALQHMHLFRGADAADLDAVAAIAEPRSYTAGESIFDQARPADALFAIVLGTVELKVPGGPGRGHVRHRSDLGEAGALRAHAAQVTAHTRADARPALPFDKPRRRPRSVLVWRCAYATRRPSSRTMPRYWRQNATGRSSSTASRSALAVGGLGA
jgi:hypothetical protein